MAYALVVVRAFGPHAPGDQIRGTAAMAAVLAGEHARQVVRVALPPMDAVERED